MNELQAALRPVKNRIRRNRLFQGAAAGFAVGAAAMLLLFAAGIWLPVENKLLTGLCLLGGCVLLPALVNALRPVDSREAAKRADACGLKERAITALELAEKVADDRDDVVRGIRETQLRDACEKLRELDPREIRDRFPKRRLLAGAAGLVLAAGVFLIPGGGDRIAAQAKALREKMAAATEKVAEAVKTDEEKISDAEKSEYRKLAEDLKRDLLSSRNEEDALVALNRAEQRLEEMRNKSAGDVRNQLGDAFSQAGMESLARAVESGDEDAIREELSGMSPEEIRAAAAGMSGDARQAAEQMAQAMEAGNPDQAAQAASGNGQNQSGEGQSEKSENSGDASQSQSGQSGQGQSGSSSSQALSQTLQSLKNALSGSNPAGTSESTGQGQQASQTGNNGNSGQNGSSGQSGGSGQGQQPGGGAGRGTTNEEQKGEAQAGSHQANGSAPPEYREGQYETIYDPEKIDTASRDVMTEQNRQGDDSVQIETGPGRGSLSGDVPYESVVGEYAESEARSADSAGLTTEQREWVDEYFRMLTEN